MQIYKIISDSVSPTPLFSNGPGVLLNIEYWILINEVWSFHFVISLEYRILNIDQRRMKFSLRDFLEYRILNIDQRGMKYSLRDCLPWISNIEYWSTRYEVFTAWLPSLNIEYWILINEVWSFHCVIPSLNIEYWILINEGWSFHFVIAFLEYRILNIDQRRMKFSLREFFRILSLLWKFRSTGSWAESKDANTW